MDGRARIADLDALTHATAHLDPPLAALDMAALRHNAADLVRRAGGKRIRIASKSATRQIAGLPDSSPAVREVKRRSATELAERLDLIHVVENGAIAASVPTYRGEGRTFG